jgi:hypothetical protein
MIAWVRDGVAPPPSRYPRLADGTLVPLARLAFPAIPGVSLPRSVHRALRLDFGPQWEQRKIITQQPPDVGTPFPVFVPQVDSDGNEIAGVRLPQLTVPVAIYTGWNLRDPKTGMPGERVSFIGSYLPFANTKAERLRTGDPRPSLEERYRSREEYLGRYAQAALGLVDDRFLLPEDLADVLRRGVQEWDEVRASAPSTTCTYPRLVGRPVQAWQPQTSMESTGVDIMYGMWVTVIST